MSTVGDSGTCNYRAIALGIINDKILDNIIMLKTLKPSVLLIYTEYGQIQ